MNRLLIRAILIVVALLLATVPALGQTSPQDELCYQKGGLIDAETGNCQIQTGIRFTMTYPTEMAQAPFADAIISGYLTQLQTGFFADFAEFFDPNMVGFPWEMDVSYDLFTHSEDVMSILFTVYDYRGGAHGNIAYQSFTFDMVAQQEITLEDVFDMSQDPLAQVAPMVQIALETHMSEMADSEWIADGTGTNPDNYRDFVLTEDSILFFFEPYQVAAYAAGPQNVSLPLADYAAVLQTRFAN